MKQWYYGPEATKRGPFSGRRLKELAAEGRICLTDMIWKDGVARGLIASKVKNLFPPAPPAGLPPTLPEIKDVNTMEGAEAAPAGELAALPNTSAAASGPVAPLKQPVRHARAVAGRGIVITSQDGVNVWFKKQCFVCGFEDGMRAKMLIKRGSNRMSFLCGKCRKMREAEFQGIV